MTENAHEQANLLFSQEKYVEAIELYNQAIVTNPENHILYSNRSACYASLKNFDDAVKDAIKCTELNPNWAKGWSRKGAALHGKGCLEEAKKAYEEGLKIDPNNAQIKAGLKAVEDSICRNFSRDFQKNDPFANIAMKLRDPTFLSKLASNPKTSSLLSDCEFMEKLKKIQNNPNSIVQELSDPRITSILPLLLGLDLDMSNNVNGHTKETSPTSEKILETEVKTCEKTEPDIKMEESESLQEQELVEEDEETKIQKENKEKADREKALGNECYKARKFGESIQHYLNAWDIHKDITYLTNCSAAYFEDGRYDECIKCCEEAISYGRSILADFKLIAKAFGRIGTAYMKQENYELAIKNFTSSLTEFRTAEILKKLREAEKLKEEKERLAYIDLDKAEESREQGNKYFKEGDFANAIKMYTDSIKRSPDDPRGYGNRAAAYIKVMSMTDALKDCEKAISLDPNFTKAHIRKAACYFIMKEYNKCIDACNSATKADENSNNKGVHAREIELQLQKCMSAMYAQRENETEEQTLQRIQNDPEIVSILQDPVMQSILSQARDNPSALEEHMKNPHVSSKIQKLIFAGVIKIARR